MSKAWPTQLSGQLPGDERTFAAVNAWLRRRGSSLSVRVEQLRGYAGYGRPTDIEYVRPFTLDRSQDEYNTFVKEHPELALVQSSFFRKKFNQTYDEVRFGVRSNRQVYVPESKIKLLIQGLTGKTWGTYRQKHGLGTEYPCATNFPRAYGKSFERVRDGAIVPVAPKAKVTRYVRDVRLTVYNRLWKEGKLPTGFPHWAQFPKHYGKSYGALRGTAWTPVMSIPEFKRVVKKHGITCHTEHVAFRKSGKAPEGYPSHVPNDFEWPSKRVPSGLMNGNVQKYGYTKSRLRECHIAIKQRTCSLVRVAKRLGISRAMAVSISGGTHWSCREGALS